MSNDNSTNFDHSVCLGVAFSSLLVFQNRKREKKGKKMCKVEFLPYARFLAPSVKKYVPSARVYVYTHNCPCVRGYLYLKLLNALLYP